MVLATEQPIRPNVSAPPVVVKGHHEKGARGKRKDPDSSVTSEPTESLGALPADLERAYRIDLARAARRSPYYPAALVAKGEQGVVRMSIVHWGSLGPPSVTLEQSSGYRELDQEALKALTHAIRMVSLPAGAHPFPYAIHPGISVARLNGLQWSQVSLVKAVTCIFTIGEIAFETKCDAAKCQLAPWDVGWRYQADFEALVAGGEGRAAQLSPIEQVHLIDVRDIDHGERCVDFDIGAGLLLGFPYGCLRRRFAVFHETAGQRPVAMPWLDGAAAQQYFSVPLRRAANDEARIFIVDMPATLADVPGQGVSCRDGQ